MMPNMLALFSFVFFAAQIAGFSYAEAELDLLHSETKIDQAQVVKEWKLRRNQEVASEDSASEGMDDDWLDSKVVNSKTQTKTEKVKVESDYFDDVEAKRSHVAYLGAHGVDHVETYYDGLTEQERDEAVLLEEYARTQGTGVRPNLGYEAPINSYASKALHHTGEALRKLVGSNCVQIERGTVTKYYMCVGCIIENAIGCK